MQYKQLIENDDDKLVFAQIFEIKVEIFFTKIILQFIMYCMKTLSN